MDLGCIDMGCIEKKTDETSPRSEISSNESRKSTPKTGKNKAGKDNSQSNSSILNKFTSQIKKPSHRKGSPLSWFPRKKVDSYLKRKIQLLQEVGGMNSTLDETLGDSNPHYSRVLREKIAVREAAKKAMEARKAAMVEASWCRILKAARIENKEAESMFLKAQQNANEAFEAAKSIGVIMYDIPDCPKKHYEIESSAINGGESTTHTVTASFETAFEVDKQVSAAVKAAFTRLANCPSISKQEFKELLRKISENPEEDSHENDNQESGYSSVCQSDIGSDLEPDGPHNKLVENMLERLRGLQEDQLANLATIVATCGLNAALAKEENIKQEGLLGFTIRKKNTEEEEEEKIENKPHDDLSSVFVKHYSKLEKEIEEAKKNGKMYESTGKKKGIEKQDIHNEIPSLDTYLVKHVSKLEREVQEAKNVAKKTEGQKGKENIDKNDTVKETSLDKIMIKPVHWSEREKKAGNEYDIQRHQKKDTSVADCESLDKVLVKHVSRLEKAKISAAADRKKEEEDLKTRRMERRAESEKSKEGSLDQVLVKHKSRLEMEKTAVPAQQGDDLAFKPIASVADCESLDKILVKHVSRLEKAKISAAADRKKEEEDFKTWRMERRAESETSKEGSLDQVLVKHKSRLEREKTAVAAQQGDDVAFKPIVGRRKEAREKELQEMWGGLSLGNSIRPHVSRLQRDKDAWVKAEEEERNMGNEEQH